MKAQHLQGSDYSWTIAIFYIGYMIFQFPISYFMQYFRVERYLGLSICCWGLVLVMLNFSSSFAGLATGRFFLGTFESIIPPAFVIVTCMPSLSTRRAGAKADGCEQQDGTHPGTSRCARSSGTPASPSSAFLLRL